MSTDCPRSIALAARFVSAGELLIPRLVQAAALSLLITLAFDVYVARAAAVAPTGASPAPNLGSHVEELLKKTLTARLEDVRTKWAAGRDRVDNRGYPGITFAYCLPEGRCDSVAVGYSDIGHRVAMRPDDRMPAGSIGKTFVAALIMQLVEEARLGLDDRIGKYLGREPWFQRLANSSEITVRMLLMMRSGLGGAGNVLRLAANDFHRNPEQLWTYVDRLPLDVPAKFPAGTDFEYRDENYDLAAAVVEKVTDDSYYTEVNRRILIPLRLQGTYPQINAGHRHLPGVVNGYQRRDDTFSLPTDISTNGTFAVSLSCEWGGGGLVSNARDLAFWARALYGGRFLNDAALAEMLHSTSPYRAWGSTETSATDLYGLGVFIYSTPYGTAYGHSGYIMGYRSAMVYLPKYDLSVALQTNTDYIMRDGKPHEIEYESLLRDTVLPLAGLIAARHLQW